MWSLRLLIANDVLGDEELVVDLLEVVVELAL